jgi:hypothetical protein
MKTVLIVAFLALIVYQLGAGLYFMITDKGTTNRTVQALTKRIALSIVLIAGVGVGIATGIIEPHGIDAPAVGR